MNIIKKINCNNIKSIVKELRWQNFIFLFIAGCLNAAGVSLFLSPSHLYDSGISGTSILLSQITPEYFTISIFLLILNIPLFLFGLKKQGISFTIYSIFAVISYAIVTTVITGNINSSMGSPVAGKDLLLCAIFGGILSGMGSGLAIRSGGAIDGMDVVAVVCAEKVNLTVGEFIMIYNMILYIICGFIVNNWTYPLYSIITFTAGLKSLDFVAEGIDHSKSVMIITDKAEEINTALLDEFKCGTTKMSATGGYSNADKTVIYFVVNRFQIYRMKTIIQKIDDKAFVTISEVADVFKIADA